MRLAVVGGGWAGLAAAVAATQAGHAVTVFEAARTWGGRARALPLRGADGGELRLDNGQHILVGAYTQTLSLMRTVGVDPSAVLLQRPLALRFPDGGGLALPAWPAPLDAAWGILRARGWSWADKRSLLAHAAHWRLRGFTCDPDLSVARLCERLSPTVLRELVEPLCVSALNVPSDRASAQVFLRVLADSLFVAGGSRLLLPRADLGTLLPDAAVRWLRAHGAQVHEGRRVQALTRSADGWSVDGLPFDAVLLACPAWEAERLVRGTGVPAPGWLAAAAGLAHEAIATVYTEGGPALPLPMLALRSGAQAPAQFVFDRAQLGGPAGLLAWVVSAAEGDTAAIESAVLAQARALGWAVQPLRTVLERRATFACTPGLLRPAQAIAPGLLACGDWVAGPYPATLEGAVRSAQSAVQALGAVTATARTAGPGR